jgi:hypothetical protein
MKPRWESPPVTFNGKPLKAYEPHPKINLDDHFPLMPRPQRKLTEAESAAVSDVTEVTEIKL